MTTMQVAFQTAGIKPTRFTTRARWPRKRYNRTAGVVRDVKTGEALRKVK